MEGGNAEGSAGQANKMRILDGALRKEIHCIVSPSFGSSRQIESPWIYGHRRNKAHRQNAGEIGEAGEGKSPQRKEGRKHRAATWPSGG
jgi:hypothetical protein